MALRLNDKQRADIEAVFDRDEITAHLEKTDNFEKSGGDLEVACGWFLLGHGFNRTGAGGVLCGEDTPVINHLVTLYNAPPRLAAKPPAKPAAKKPAAKKATK